MMCGGLGEIKPADAHIQDIVKKVQGLAQNKASRKFDVFQAITYSSQVVAGTNYFVKVKVAVGEFVHLRVFKTLPCYGDELELHGIQEGKSEEDELVHF